MKNWDPLVLGPALAIDKMPTMQQLKRCYYFKTCHVFGKKQTNQPPFSYRKTDLKMY